MYLSVDEPNLTGGLYSDDGKMTQTLIYTAATTAIHQVSITTQSKLLTGGYTIKVDCLPAAVCGKQRSVRH